MPKGRKLWLSAHDCLTLYMHGHTIREIAAIKDCGRQAVCSRLRSCDDYVPSWTYGRNRTADGAWLAAARARAKGRNDGPGTC